MVGGGVEKRRIYWGNFPSRNLLWGKKISMKGAQDFLALFKKKMKVLKPNWPDMTINNQER